MSVRGNVRARHPIRGHKTFRVIATGVVIQTARADDAHLGDSHAFQAGRADAAEPRRGPAGEDECWVGEGAKGGTSLQSVCFSEMQAIEGAAVSKLASFKPNEVSSLMWAFATLCDPVK